MAAGRRLAERDGLGKLSLTRLGRQLRAGSTSLYSYFPSMEDLVSAVVDDVTEEVYSRLPVVGSRPWDEEIIDHHVAVRRLMERTPFYRETFSYRAQSRERYARMPPAMLLAVEDLLALLVRSGMSADDAIRTFNVLSAYSRAFILSEHGLHPEAVDPAALYLVGAAMAQAAPGSGLAELDFAGLARVDEAGYRLGLELLVEGARQRYLAPSRAPVKAAAGKAPARRRKTNGSR